MNLLHLTHTDISVDSRILKEIEVVRNKFPDDNVFGLGIDSFSGAGSHIGGVDIFSVKIITKKKKYIPDLFTHTAFVLELIFKFFIKGLALKPNIIHCHDLVILPLGVLLKIMTGSKLIYDAHELESDKNGMSPILGIMSLMVERSLWSFVDRLIVVSPSIDQWYQDKLGKKISNVILNSPHIEGQKSEFNMNYLKDKFQIKGNKKIFIYVGAFSEGRGIELLLDVFKKDNIESILIFLGDGKLKARLIVESENSEQIFVHPPVDHDKVVRVAKSADIGLCLIENVSLSDYYSLPNKLFEYAFAELPVLASNFPDIRKIVDMYGLGSCCSMDEESIYNAVTKLEKDDYGLKVNTGKLYELSWEAQGKKLETLYNGLFSEINT